MANYIYVAKPMMYRYTYTRTSTGTRTSTCTGTCTYRYDSMVFIAEHQSLCVGPAWPAYLSKYHKMFEKSKVVVRRSRCHNTLNGSSTR
jgi:hypothetical protein